MVCGKKAHPPVWSPNPNIYCNDVAILTFAESQSGSDGRGLRSYRHVRTHRQSGVGLQRYRHRAATLVRHVGVAETSDRTVAHAEGPGRRRQKLSKTTKQPTSRQLNTKKNIIVVTITKTDITAIIIIILLSPDRVSGGFIQNNIYLK